MMDNGYFQKIEDEFLAGTYQKIPVLAARAQGANIWDLEGKEYLDLMSGYGVAILGHSDEKIKAAIMQQMQKVYITHASVYSPARAAFLKDFMSIAPGNIHLCHPHCVLELGSAVHLVHHISIFGFHDVNPEDAFSNTSCRFYGYILKFRCDGAFLGSATNCRVCPPVIIRLVSVDSSDDPVSHNTCSDVPGRPLYEFLKIEDRI